MIGGGGAGGGGGNGAVSDLGLAYVKGECQTQIVKKWWSGKMWEVYDHTAKRNRVIMGYGLYPN